MMPSWDRKSKDFDDVREQAVWLEHGNRHSAHIHSKNVDRITTYAKAIDTAIVVKNGPSYSAPLDSEEKVMPHLQSQAVQVRDLQAQAHSPREDAA